MKFFTKWKKHAKRLKKGHKVFRSVKRNSGRLASVVRLIHKTVIK